MTSALCQHSYCPHLHFKKCRKERESKMAYTTRPQKEIQIQCNVHPKMLELSTRNIPTLAYEQYSLRKSVPDQDEMNFSKNYYLENCPDNFQLRNTLVKDKQDELYEQSAYVLAINASKQYNIFSRQRQEHLINARKRAKISYHNYFENKKQEMMKLKEQQTKWVIDYFRKVQQLIDHMFGKDNSQNVDPNLQDKLFIKENQNKNTKFLAAFKVSDPAAALQILKSLRALLLRKKMSLQEQRKDQEHNKSVSASCIDSSASQSQDVTQGTSFLSAATNDLTKEQGEQHFAEQFCDFVALQKRWGVKNVQQIRNIIRRLLAKSLVIHAEGRQMRDKKAAKLKNQLLQRQMKEMGQLTGKQNKSKKDETKSRQKTASSTKKDKKPSIIQNNIQELLPMFRQSLNNEDLKVKATILKGGQFDSVGDKYERNRNYSLLFQKKRAQSQLELSFREQKPFYRPQTTRK